MTKHDIRTALITAVVAIAVTWCAATSDWSPIKPQPDRPVLRFIQRLARVGLWVMWAAEPPPASQQHYVVHARVDEHGHRVLNHGNGW
jgi:hypothetical protein